MNKFNLRNITDIILIILILLDLIFLLGVSFYDVSSDIYRLIIYFDLFVCFILFGDFIYRLLNEKGSKFMFITNNWIDIIAMVPIDLLGPFFGNYVGYLRLLRLVRVIALFKSQLKRIFNFFKDTHLDYTVGMLIFLIFTGTILFFIFEQGNNLKIHNLGDSFWCTIVTILAGGGDIYPITNCGRIIWIVLTAGGVTFGGMLTASIASWFINRSKKDEEILENKIINLENLMKDTTNEIKELKDLIKNKK